MILWCEDHRLKVEAIPTVWNADVLEGLTVEDDEHMDCDLSAGDTMWEDWDYDRDIDFA